MNAECFVHYPNGTIVKAGTLITKDANVNIEIVIRNLSLSVAIRDITIPTMYINSTYMGYFECSTFLANYALNVGLLYYNSFFATLIHVDLPDNLFNIFSLKDLNVNYFDGYVQFGLTPVFIP